MVDVMKSLGTRVNGDVLDTVKRILADWERKFSETGPFVPKQSDVDSIRLLAARFDRLQRVAVRLREALDAKE
jgi:hypothetical protein